MFSLLLKDLISDFYLIKKHIYWKVKIRTESNRGKKCMFDCNVTKIDVRQSDYHFADIETNYTKLHTRNLAGNSTCLLILNCWFARLSKEKKTSMGVQEKEQLWVFYIDCKKMDTSFLLASRARKAPDICLL